MFCAVCFVSEVTLSIDPIIVAVSKAKKQLADYAGDEKHYENLALNDITKEAQAMTMWLTKNDKDTGEVCPYFNMQKTGALLVKSVKNRPKDEKAKAPEPPPAPVVTALIIENIMNICEQNDETYRVCQDTKYDDVVSGLSEGACLIDIPEDAMKVLRQTPGIAAHAKWLKSQCEQSGK